MRMLPHQARRLPNIGAGIDGRAAKSDDLIDVKSGPQFGAYTP